MPDSESDAGKATVSLATDIQQIRALLTGYVPRGYLTLEQACHYLGAVTIREAP